MLDHQATKDPQQEQTQTPQGQAQDLHRQEEKIL
jgi:hypothetical protein